MISRCASVRRFCELTGLRHSIPAHRGLGSYDLCLVRHFPMSGPSYSQSESSPKRRRLSMESFSSVKLLTKMSSGQPIHDGQLPTIKLNALESTLRQLLLDIAQFIDSSRSSKPEGSPQDVPLQLAESPTILRFTGGWVRDKLLGVDSQDIDVAINKMTGLQFGLKMKEYLEMPGNAEKYGIGKRIKGSADSEVHDKTTPQNTAEALGIGGLHKIAANPEKSKHLETITTKVLGLDIDLVNLRTETYSEASRNPQMAFGTPEEDALRRDATVNALFYNLNTSLVEDYTGRGLSDMKDKIIRTPLEPRQTFLDDPLRVLRLVRFASRLGFSIDENTSKAMDNDDIRSALTTKISRERVGTEFEKMLKGKSPLAALSLIDNLDLYSTVYPPPPGMNELKPVMTHWNQAYEYVDRLVQTSSLHEDTDKPGGQDVWTVASTLLSDTQSIYHAWVLASLVPWAEAPRPPPHKRTGQISPPVPATVAKEGIRATNKLLAIITAAFNNANEVTALQRKVVSELRTSTSRSTLPISIGRDTLGMAIRKWGLSWKSQVLLSFLLDIVRSSREQESEADIDAITSSYAAFLRHLRDLDLLEAHMLQPLLDGKQLMTALGIKSGPWLKDALELVVAWQLRNPGVTDTQSAIREVEGHREELGLS